MYSLNHCPSPRHLPYSGRESSQRSRYLLRVVSGEDDSGQERCSTLRGEYLLAVLCGGGVGGGREGGREGGRGREGEREREGGRGRGREGGGRGREGEGGREREGGGREGGREGGGLISTASSVCV